MKTYAIVSKTARSPYQEHVYVDVSNDAQLLDAINDLDVTACASPFAYVTLDEALADYIAHEINRF